MNLYAAKRIVPAQVPPARRKRQRVSEPKEQSRVKESNCPQRLLPWPAVEVVECATCCYILEATTIPQAYQSAHLIVESILRIYLRVLFRKPSYTLQIFTAEFKY